MKRIMKQRIDEIHSIQQLKELILEIWDAFPQDAINRLVGSFQGRMRMAIHENGRSISDLLRNGIHSIPNFPLPKYDVLLPLNDLITMMDPSVDDEPITHRAQRSWTPDEDLLLLQKYKDFGKRWTKMAVYFKDRTPKSIRSRFRYLYHEKRKK